MGNQVSCLIMGDKKNQTKRKIVEKYSLQSLMGDKDIQIIMPMITVKKHNINITSQSESLIISLHCMSGKIYTHFLSLTKNIILINIEVS